MHVQDGLLPHVRPMSQDKQDPRPCWTVQPLGAPALGWHLVVGLWVGQGMEST